MNLTLKNIGKIGTASVEINGITVIAGENDTGKSTVGRALFSVFNSFYNIDIRIRYERIKSIEKRTSNLMYSEYHQNLMKIIIKHIVSDINLYRNDIEAIKIALIPLEDNIEADDSFIYPIALCIKEVLDVSDEELQKSLLEKNLNTEFNGQTSNMFSAYNGEIKLTIKDKCLTIFIDNDEVIGLQNKDNFQIYTEAVYIDDPFVLDNLAFLSARLYYEFSNHRNHLIDKLLNYKKDTNLVDKVIITNKFENIYKKISLICNGDVIKDKNFSFGYKRAGSDKVLDIRNLSAGLKTFVLLKMLLKNEVIQYNGTVILDEPEIHLHPEWQLLFAELIVLLQKEFGMHILLNTHSPYFLNAVEVYALKYGVNDKCKYYLASVKDGFSVIEDVTYNTELIYSKLARPLQDLENERYQYD